MWPSCAAPRPGLILTSALNMGEAHAWCAVRTMALVLVVRLCGDTQAGGSEDEGSGEESGTESGTESGSAAGSESSDTREERGVCGVCV